MIKWTKTRAAPREKKRQKKISIQWRNKRCIYLKGGGWWQEWYYHHCRNVNYVMESICFFDVDNNDDWNGDSIKSSDKCEHHQKIPPFTTQLSQKIYIFILWKKTAFLLQKGRGYPKYRKYAKKLCVYHFLKQVIFIAPLSTSELSSSSLWKKRNPPTIFFLLGRKYSWLRSNIVYIFTTFLYSYDGKGKKWYSWNHGYHRRKQKIPRC